MGINKKIFAIQENREAAIAAIDGYLDYAYSLRDTFLDENGNLKEFLTPDANAEALIPSEEKANIYENIRMKLKNEDFNLSLFEINYIGLAFFFSQCKMKNRIDELKIAIDEIKDINSVLFESSDPQLKEIIDSQS